MALGHARLGAGLLAQVVSGMRPSEMLGVRGKDLLFPEQRGSTLFEHPLVIALGVKTGTKSKRPQVAVISSKYPYLVEILRSIVAHTAQENLLFPYTINHYRSLIHQVESSLGLSVGWGAHSPRAGFASDARAAGVPFEEVREAGRWQSDTSLRTYLDIVSAFDIQVSLRTSGFAPALAWLDRFWWTYFSEAVIVSASLRNRDGAQRVNANARQRLAPRGWVDH